MRWLSVVWSMAVLLVFLSGGCEKEQDVRFYQAPKETSTVSDGNPHSAGTTSDSNETGFPGDMRWTLPAGWKQVPPPPARMGIRAAAAIAVSPNDPAMLLTLSVLGGTGRDIYPNVVRWAGLIQVPPPPQEELAKYVSHRQVGELAIDVIDLTNTGTPRQRLLGAVIPHANETWAMKVSGPTDQLTAQKAAFDEFIASIHFESGGAPAAQLPAGHPSIGPATPTTPAPTPPAAPNANPTAATGVEGATWKLPGGWSAELATGGFRLATIHPSATTEIKVSKFNGLGGGAGANATRWRGEVGLGPVDDAEADPGQQVTLGSQPWTIHDYSGPANGGSRLIVALGQGAGGETWFFKLSGAADAVAPVKPAFDEFLGSIRFAH